jgi:hypothetical protein
LKPGLLPVADVPLVTEEAAVLGGMIFRQGVYTVGAVTIGTEFFRLFFVHGHEALMIAVMGKPCCRFRRRVPEKEEDSGAEYDKKKIGNQYFLFAVYLFLHYQPPGGLCARTRPAHERSVLLKLILFNLTFHAGEDKLFHCRPPDQSRINPCCPDALCESKHFFAK